MQNEPWVESDGNEYKCELHQKYQMKLIWTQLDLGFGSRIPLLDGALRPLLQCERRDSPIDIKAGEQNEQLVRRTISGCRRRDGSRTPPQNIAFMKLDSANQANF